MKPAISDVVLITNRAIVSNISFHLHMWEESDFFAMPFFGGC
jgi:hypothetical protein